MKYEAVNSVPRAAPIERWARSIATIVGVFFLVLGSVMMLQPRGIHLVGVREGTTTGALRPGSLAIAWPAREYASGDLVVYETPGTGALATSRIVSRSATGVGPTRYRLQDDGAVSLEQQTLSVGSLAGRIEAVVPWIGYAALAIQTPVGFALLAIGPLIYALIAGMLEARRRWRLQLYEATFYPGPGFTHHHHAGQAHS